jgi:hypothetical protein
MTIPIKERDDLVAAADVFYDDRTDDSRKAFFAAVVAHRKAVWGNELVDTRCHPIKEPSDAISQ